VLELKWLIGKCLAAQESRLFKIARWTGYVLTSIVQVLVQRGPVAKTVEISKFRSEIFSLFDSVVENEGDTVVIERRGHPMRAVLTSERHLVALHQQLLALRKAVATMRQAAGGGKFKLVGSAELQVPPDEVLSKSRGRQAELLSQKRKSLE